MTSTELQKKMSKGKPFAVRCMFHTEKTGSLTIDPRTGKYYCFGCQAEGNIKDLPKGGDEMEEKKPTFKEIERALHRIIVLHNKCNEALKSLSEGVMPELADVEPEKTS